MRSMPLRLSATVALALATAAPLSAQQPAPEPAPAPNCPADAQPIPTPLAAWNDEAGEAGAADAAGAARQPLTPGTPVTLALMPTDRVTMAVTPGRAAQPGRHAGLAAITVPTAGTYRFALGAGAWIDVVRDGRAVTSAAHGHGPACSGIRKIVDFALTPGLYVVQISDSPVASVRLLMAAP